MTEVLDETQAAGATVGAGLLTDISPAIANDGGLNKGDAAILRFLSALEQIEQDLWLQFQPLGEHGVRQPIGEQFPCPATTTVGGQGPGCEVAGPGGGERRRAISGGGKDSHQIITHGKLRWSDASPVGAVAA